MVFLSAITGPSPKEATSSKPKALSFLLIWAQSSQGVSVCIFSEKLVVEDSGEAILERDRQGVHAQGGLVLRLLLARGPREPSGLMEREDVHHQACLLLTCSRPLNPPSPRGDSVQRHRRHPPPDSGVLPGRLPSTCLAPASALVPPRSPHAFALISLGSDSLASATDRRLHFRCTVPASQPPPHPLRLPPLPPPSAAGSPKAVPASLCLMASQAVGGCPSSTERCVLAALPQPNPSFAWRGDGSGPRSSSAPQAASSPRSLPRSRLTSGANRNHAYETGPLACQLEKRMTEKPTGGETRPPPQRYAHRCLGY